MNFSYPVLSLMAILILAMTATISNGFSQSLQLPEFKSKSTTESNTIMEDDPNEQIAMKVQLEEHENPFLADADYYQASDFAFAATNNSKLCPNVNCEYELEGGQMPPAFIAGERSLDGKFKVNTGESKKIFDLRATWEAVEERDVDGELSQVIEGKLGIGKDKFNPQFEYEINGTLTTDDDEYILQVMGIEK
jgi:hypothetical protein